MSHLPKDQDKGVEKSLGDDWKKETQLTMADLEKVLVENPTLFWVISKKIMIGS